MVDLSTKHLTEAPMSYLLSQMGYEVCLSVEGFSVDSTTILMCGPLSMVSAEIMDDGEDIYKRFGA